MSTKFEPDIAVIGGGTGLSVLLRGLKKYTPHLTAVVSVTDDGGSSGALRRELGVLPPGDIRNCLVALSEEETLLSRLFQYRFPSVGSLSGHSFGNLFLTAMSAIAGSFDQGIFQSSKVLAVRGRVLPVTLSSVTLEARLDNGRVIKGESNISRIGSKVTRLNICPEAPPAAPNVIKALSEADGVVIGPGSLYTSIIANLLVKGISANLKKIKVPRIYVCNIMTQAGETSNYRLSDHLNALNEHAHGNIADYVVVNVGKIPSKIAARYKKEDSFPVIIDYEKIGGVRLIKADLVSRHEYARHDSEKLAKVIVEILKGTLK